MRGRAHLLSVGMFFVVSAASVVATSAVAHAQDMAGLRFEANQVDAQLTGALNDEVDRAFASVDRWRFLGFDSSRARMSPVTRDCFTRDCLSKVGQAVGAPAGLDVEMTGEAEIYEWTITIWDLRSGDKLESERNTCELCGKAEVKRTFRSNLQAALIAASLPDQAGAPTPPAPPNRHPDPRVSGQNPTSGQPSNHPQSNHPRGSGQPHVSGPKTTLRVSVVPADTEVFIDDQSAGRGQLTRALGAGEHDVRFHREGYQGLRERVVINEGTRGPVILSVHLSRTDPDAVEVPGATGPIDRLGNARPVLGAVSVGVGAVLVGTGIYLTAIDGNTACETGVPDTQCPEVYATGGAGLTMGVIGAVLATGGVTMLTWEALAGDPDQSPAATPADGEEPSAPSDGRDEAVRDGAVRDAASIAVSPAVGAGSAGVLLHGRF